MVTDEKRKQHQGYAVPRSTAITTVSDPRVWLQALGAPLASRVIGATGDDLHEYLRYPFINFRFMFELHGIAH